MFTIDDGTTCDAVGLQDADHGLYGVDADRFDDVTVSGGGGSVWTWDGSQWRCEDTGDAMLRDVEVGDGGALTVGDGGNIYRRDAEGWQQEARPVGDNLKAVFRGDPDVAVGAGGTALEH